jgi:hypothetical protein
MPLNVLRGLGSLVDKFLNVILSKYALAVLISEENVFQGLCL